MLLNRISLSCIIVLLISFTFYAHGRQIKSHYDIVVYGGTSSGVIAAYTAKQSGKSVLLIEPGVRLGGLTTGGLGYTDIGNKYAIKGLSLDFYRKVGQQYGNFEQWIFEPHVAENVFKSYIKKAEVEVLYNYRIIHAQKQGNKIIDIVLENSIRPSSAANKTIYGSEFIDCSYEGDLMAKAGVSYTVGREDNMQYNETYNGVQFRDKHQFPDGIDPYKIPGDPKSCLVWGISDGKLMPDGTGNKMVQTYNIRICLTNDSANRITITPPDDYNPQRYELLLRLLAKRPVSSVEGLMTLSAMPNHKTDINNNGAFSTDMIGMSWNYPEAGYKERAAIFTAHENYIKGLFYFIGHDHRMPAYLRNQMLQYGYPKDEYINTGHFTTQMYVREARRLIGEYVMTQANCQGKEVVTDGIGMAAYTMDSHNAERIVVNGTVKNEGDVQIGGFGPYPVAYRSLIPKRKECTNLLVPVCLSASHIAYGSIRMEPVFMMLGQSAATAACMAIDNRCPVQDIDVKKLQASLVLNPLADGSTPEILIDNDDTKGLTVSGKWKTRINQDGCYGPSSLVSDTSITADDFVSFAPEVKKSGDYHLYTYLAKPPGISTVINIRVNDGNQLHEVYIKTKDIIVKGQTEGEWVSLGGYHLNSGNGASITITGKNSDGIIVADAVLFIPAVNK